MKKNSILCLALLCLSMLPASAQKEWDPSPFKHLSLGVGASTAGVDLELSTTLGYHFKLRAGISALPYTYSMSYDMGLGDMFSEIDATILNKADVDPAAIPNEVDIAAGLGLMNGKVLMDIYPFKKAGIHLTAGVYFGNDELLRMGLQMPEEFMDAVKQVREYEPNFADDFILPLDESAVNMAMKVQKVKPYVGFGLSRAVPKRRLGFNVDCGVMFHGNPTIECNSQSIIDMLEEEGMTEMINKVVVYPVISFRLVGRIF